MVDVPFIVIAVIVIVFVLAIALIVFNVRPPGTSPGPPTPTPPSPLEDTTPTTFLGSVNTPIAGSTSIAVGRTTTGTDVIFVGNPVGAGRVYVYSRTGNAVPVLQTTILPPPGVTGFGQSVACSQTGEDLAIGAPTSGVTINTGYVGFYQRNPGPGYGWSLVFSDTSVTPTSMVTSKFGTSVAVSPDGRLAAVGEPGARDGEGLVTVYTRPVYGAWTAVQRFNASELETGIGKSVAVSKTGTIIVVGGDDKVWFHVKNGSGMFSQIKVIDSGLVDPVVTAGSDALGFSKPSSFELVDTAGVTLFTDAVVALGADASPSGRSIAVASGAGSKLYHRNSGGAWSVATSAYAPGIDVAVSGGADGHVALYVLTSVSYQTYV